MKELEVFKKYCSGCGLCNSILDIKGVRNEKGFYVPQLDESNIEWCRNICPAGGKITDKKTEAIWGIYSKVIYGWSSSNYIRQEASSGGVMTSLCTYMLGKGIIDGIIQTRASDEKVYETTTVISRTTADVNMCLGSRYAISSPLEDIKELMKEGEVYAFVGKPCDVSVLRLYLKQDELMSSQIRYLLSFFCAGMPSNIAQKKLLMALDIKEAGECRALRYRGNGWPGYAIAEKNNGTCNSMSYNESWGKILGRDIPPSCRMCIDGIGLAADIVCGDAWYLNGNEPDFSEKDGRNVVFIRTQRGNQLLDDAINDGYINIDTYHEILDELKLSQKFQFERRATMSSMLLAHKLFNLEYPHYDKKYMSSLSKNIGFKTRFRRFLGTIRRIKKGRVF